MDAHLFRRVAFPIADILSNSRVQNIYAPLPELTAFQVFSAGTKTWLFLLTHKKTPLMFTAPSNPFPNPAIPSAHVMFLRKHIAGRRLHTPVIDWLGRRLAFAVPGPNQTQGWLVLDLNQGASYLQQLPTLLIPEPHWPERRELATLLAPEAPTAGAERPWQAYPVLTPALRRTLSNLEEPEAAALLIDMESGEGDLFAYGKDDVPSLLSAWPLPSQFLPKDCHEIHIEQHPAAILDCLRVVSEKALLRYAADTTSSAAHKPAQATAKRQGKLLRTLLTEQAKLEKTLLLREHAKLLQANLWRYTPEEKQGSVTLPALPDMQFTASQEIPSQSNGNVTIILDPLITVHANMRSMFKQSARAARGLGILTARITAMEAGETIMLPSGQKTRQPRASLSPKQYQAAKNWKEFRSTDGFLLLRGKNAKGNKELCKLARPFDIWLHAEDGPSAHLIIKRDHAAHEVPDQTLHEAGILVGLKSWQSEGRKAHIMYALAKDVRQIKGAPDGTVRVDNKWKTLLVSLDDGLEQRLAVER